MDLYALALIIQRDLTIAYPMNIALAPTNQIRLFDLQEILFVKEVRLVSMKNMQFTTRKELRCITFRCLHNLTNIHCHVCVLGTLSCGGRIAYPDCSFCPSNNQTMNVNRCDGNCQLNSHTHLCEEKGIRTVNVIIEICFI